MRKRMVRSCLAVVSCLLTVSGANAQIPEGFSTTPAFQDEFEEKALDLTKWEHRQPGERFGCHNTERSVSLQDGFLRITTFSEEKDGILKSYCGMISTQTSFQQIYGYWEAAVRFHWVKGTQVAFWLQSPTMGKEIGNPETSGVEIDIFEHIAGAPQNGYDHAIHWDGYEEHHKQWDFMSDMEALSDGQFHVFGLAWSPEGYRFYIDGVEQHLSGLEHVPVSAAQAYVILSSELRSNALAKGYGPLEGSVTTFDVDYVRVYPYKGLVSPL